VVVEDFSDDEIATVVLVKRDNQLSSELLYTVMSVE